METADAEGGSVGDVDPKANDRRCAHCCKKFVTFLFSTVGLMCLMVGYTALGGYIFMLLEGPQEVKTKTNMLLSRKWHAQRLWNLTLDLNILHPDNWTAMAEGILENYTLQVYMATKNQGWDGTDAEGDIQWSFAGALLYAITVITTIGKSGLSFAHLE